MRLIVADDSALFRELVAHTLASFGKQVVAQAATADELRAAVESTPCDVVLADIRMPPTHTDDGLQACLRIRESHPRLGIVLLSQYGEVEYATQLIEAVPDRVGYLLKERATGARELLDVVERVAAGGVVVDPMLVTRLMTRRRVDNPLDQLTTRESQVLALMAEGLGNTAISRTMAVTLSTVEKHATSVFRKLALEAADAGENARVSAVLTYLRHTGRRP
jgi:DNA-binding NarL/FixJ family response regulator